MKKRSINENVVFLLIFVAAYINATNNFFGLSNTLTEDVHAHSGNIIMVGATKETIPTEDEILAGMSSREIFDYYVKNQKYIMHAGGSIDNKKYTNSYDAIAYNYENGNRIFEIDLNFTKDNEVVLVHGWTEYDYQYRLGLTYNKKNAVMDSNTFKKTLLYGKYTTMTINDLINFMREHPYSYFILNIKEGYTTKTSKTSIQRIVTAANRDSKILNRFIIWGYNPEIVQEVKKIYNFELLSMYYKNVKLMDKKINSNEKFIQYCVDNNISSIILTIPSYNDEIIRMAKEKGIYIFLYTIDNEMLANSYLNKDITMIMSNYLTNKKAIEE